MFINLRYRIDHTAWYIKPEYFRSLKASLAEKLPMLQQDDGDGIEEFLSFFINQRPPMSIDRAGIALITISGVLGNNLAPIDKLIGLTDYQDIIAEIEEATEAGAKAILFEIDSPGGEAQGAPETAARIAGIDVPKASYTAGLDCSAAYFLSVSCDRKFVSPSALTGSIGTILPWIDESKLWDAFGISWEPIIGAGETFKGAGAGPSLSDAERDHLQKQIDQMSGNFRDHVSNFRELDFTHLQGAAYFGKEAIDLNLADDQGSYDDAYQWLFRLVS